MNVCALVKPSVKRMLTLTKPSLLRQSPLQFAKVLASSPEDPAARLVTGGAVAGCFAFQFVDGVETS